MPAIFKIVVSLVLTVSFGAMSDVVETTWPSTSPIWGRDPPSFYDDQHVSTPKASKLEDVLKRSLNFPITFPINSTRCSKLKLNQSTLESYINSAYPVIHESALKLCSALLDHKQRFGSNIERDFYRNMTLLKLVNRLLTKRAVSFLGSADLYLLLDGSRGNGWEDIGTYKETPPLTLENVLSYDELKVSALLSVSSFTHFINNGNRNNDGIENHVGVQHEGVIIGLIGARFEKFNRMEYCEVIKSKEQNIYQNGYGLFALPTMQGVFMNFYDESSLTYQELELGPLLSSDRMIKIGKEKYFDKVMYSKRIALSIDTLLVEANDRAKRAEKKAFVHVVGLALGSWKIVPEQDQIFLDTFARRIEFLKGTLEHLSDVYFAHFQVGNAGQYKDGDRIKLPNQTDEGIAIHFGDREPHEELTGADSEKLLVVFYSWDGNALPGNEFWLGSLSASGDPAAASSTQIAELHNPHINPAVTAANLRVATLKEGLLAFNEFRESRKKRLGALLRNVEISRS